MESTEASHVSSPTKMSPPRGSESPPRGSESPPKDSADDKHTHIRFLLSNMAAGSVIGKGGSTISDLQTKSGARIQLSRNQEFFPGTTDRIVSVSGTINEVVKAVELILAKLQSELHAEDSYDVEPRTRVRLVVPNSSCGSIIGKAGNTIKSLIEDSQAGIKISPVEDIYYGLSDRLVTVTGTLEEQMRAVDLILAKLTDDAHYSQTAHAPYSYPAPYNGSGYFPSNGYRGRFQNHKEDTNSSVTMGVPDQHIGLVVGRGGRNITEISQITGARIKISERGDFMSGSTDRKVTITGSQRAVQQAESMILQKVSYASERAAE